MTLLLMILACTTPAPEQGTDPAQPAALTQVRLALNWFPEPEFGGFYEGALGDIYKDAGFDVTVIPGGAGAPTLEQLTAGKVEVAITAADELLVKRTKGVKAVGAWPAFQITPHGLLVHSDGPSTFEALAQDQQVAIELGSPLQAWLWKRYSWDGKVQAVPYGGGVGQFIADPTFIQQAFITAEPCMAEAKGQEVQFLRAADAGWNPYATLVAFSDPPPAWAGDFVRATQAAWEAYEKDPSRADAEISRLNDQMKPELMACIHEAQAPFITGADGMGAMTQARWDTTAANLVSLGLLPEGSTAEGAWVDLR